MSSKSKRWMWAMGLAAAAAHADPGYYVVTTYSDEGLRFVDTRYWTVKPSDDEATRWPEFGFGYGVTSRWTTELYASYIGSTEYATHLATVNWQNDVLLTQGQFPFDLALHVTVIHNESSSRGEGVEYGPVFQTDIGRTQLNANLFFERDFGTGNTTPQLKYQWQMKYRWMHALQLGLQGFGELGDWDHWLPHDQQSHRAGPAFFGGWPLGDGHELRYQAAFLFGSVYGSHAGMFTTRVYYTF